VGAPQRQPWTASVATPAPHLLRRSRAAALGVADSARRGSLVVREVVRANGDNSLFTATKGALIRPVQGVAAVLVSSELAVHIIEHHSRRSAVCSYNRLLRFDTAEVDDDIFAAFSCYMGTTPVAERLQAPDAFMPVELGNYVLRLPPTTERDRVLATIAAGVARHGIPEETHNIKRLI